MQEIKVSGLLVKNGKLTLKPLKKSDYKSFVTFSVEYDGREISIEEYQELYFAKEFSFMQTGNLWVYLFEKQSDNKFEVGEIVGFCEISQREEDVAEIGYYIKQSKRNMGYGRKMLEMAIALCDNMKYKRIIAKASIANTQSIALLKSKNFDIQAKTDKIIATLTI